MSRTPQTLRRSLDAHCARLNACRQCALSPGVQPIVSRARAPRGMLVGQAPGQTESAGGRPFAGRAGKTLFKWLARAGLDEATARELFYIAAVTRCYPGPHRAGRGDRVPSPAERARCSGWLADELRIICPAVIIPVGRLAIETFLGAVPLAAVVGQEHEVQHAAGHAVVIPLPHPSGASSWIHVAEHKVLLQRALELIGKRVRTLDLPSRSVA
ncbi:uracil-DNA glycosylase family protein [soil metagenome]